MPSLRIMLQRNFYLAERELKAVEALVLILLAVLLGYTVWLSFMRAWDDLLKLLPAATAACAAVLVAKTATRLLNYNMLVREDDRAHTIIRITHHSLAVINDLRSRIHYIGVCLSAGNRPLAAITENAEAIRNHYESLYDRDIYEHLPGKLIDSISSLSGSIFGLSSLISVLASPLGNEVHRMLPPTEAGKEPTFAQAIEKLNTELNDLYSQFESFRKTIE